MEESVTSVTECCGAEWEEGAEEGSVCGADNPLVVESEPAFLCEHGGFAET